VKVVGLLLCFEPLQQAASGKAAAGCAQSKAAAPLLAWIAGKTGAAVDVMRRLFTHGFLEIWHFLLGTSRWSGAGGACVAGPVR
jgi:hypothetical protein